MYSTIILIGPMCAGKSTIAQLLAQKLGIPHYSVDDDRWEYYKEMGYDSALAATIAKSDQGMLGLLQYWKPFEAYAVERALADHQNCVVDLGAGHSVHEDKGLFARVQSAMAPYPNVILLLPSPDLDESVKILNARFGKLLREQVGAVDEKLFGVNEQFVKHPSNHLLAKRTIYTDGKTPEQTCIEILAHLTKLE